MATTLSRGQLLMGVLSITRRLYSSSWRPGTEHRASVKQKFPALESLVFGIHPALAVLRCRSRAITKAYILTQGLAINDAGVTQLLKRLDTEERASATGGGGIHVVRTDRDMLDRLTRGNTHQGIVLVTEPLQPLELPYGLSPGSFLKQFGQGCSAPLGEATADTSSARTHSPLLVALGDITDPHNAGAIVRSALVLDADGVVVTGAGGRRVASEAADGSGGRDAGSQRARARDDDSPANALLGPTVAKTSSGALDVWSGAGRLFSTRNVATLCGSLSAAGWRVLGTAMAPTGGKGGPPSPTGPVHVPFRELRREDAVGTLLVLGNEGSGLPSSVLQACTHVTHIPMEGRLQLEAMARGERALGRQRRGVETSGSKFLEGAAAADDGAPSGSGAAAQPSPRPRAKLPVDSLNVAAAAALLLQQLRPAS